MIYPFKCDDCHNYTEVYRPAKDAGKEELCDKCGRIMRRIYTSPQLRIVTMNGYNVGLGCRQRDVKDTLKRIHDTEGRELVEIGNEKIPHTQGQSNYNLTDSDRAELNRIMD